MAKVIATVLITDLDNTLFDWFDMWYYPFNAMLNKISEISGIERAVLERDAKIVHEKHKTSEYTYLIEELRCLQEKHKEGNFLEIYEPAIEAFREEKVKKTKLYKNVLTTLKEIKKSGALIVGYTESMAYYSLRRLQRLGLDGILDYIYTREEHDLPDGKQPSSILQKTIVKKFPRDKKKPAPEILLDIINDLGASKKRAIYVGDSLMKDIVMAKQAEVISVHAKYGEVHRAEEYELLQKVTHWRKEDVENEQKITIEDVQPDYVLHKNFKEILGSFEFREFYPLNQQNSPDKENQAIKIWMKIVDVQQHFNEIEMKIRSIAITTILAIFGAAGFTMKENMTFVLRGYEMPLALFILVAGTIGLIGFYIMDRFWYHQLLHGAVRHGRFIEETYLEKLPELGLATKLKSSSPFNVFGFEIRSNAKINFFYFIFFMLLVLFMGAIGGQVKKSELKPQLDEKGIKVQHSGKLQIDLKGEASSERREPRTRAKLDSG